MVSTSKDNTKVQNENERYVKYYELQNCLTEALTQFSEQINGRLDDISANTKGLVTYAQHERDLKLLEDKVDLKYGGTKSNFNKINWIVVTVVINVVVSALAQLANGIMK